MLPEFRNTKRGKNRLDEALMWHFVGNSRTDRTLNTQTVR